MKLSKLNPLIIAAGVILTGNANAAVINFNLTGLDNPTGVATNGGTTRQFAYTTTGGELTITYTIDVANMPPPVSLVNAYQFPTLFRRPGSGAQLPATGGNMSAGESLTITLDSIVANTGWTLNSLTKSSAVAVAGDSRNGNEQATFEVNDDGSEFTLGGIGSTGISTLTDSRFTAFDSVGDSLRFTTTAGNVGRLNLQGIAFTADITMIPEPSSSLLGGLGLLALLRRRRA